MIMSQHSWRGEQDWELWLPWICHPDVGTSTLELGTRGQQGALRRSWLSRFLPLGLCSGSSLFLAVFFHISFRAWLRGLSFVMSFYACSSANTYSGHRMAFPFLGLLQSLSGPLWCHLALVPLECSSWCHFLLETGTHLGWVSSLAGSFCEGSWEFAEWINTQR